MEIHTPTISESIVVSRKLTQFFMERCDYGVIVGQNAPGVLKVYTAKKANIEKLDDFLAKELPDGFMGHRLNHDKYPFG